MVQDMSNCIGNKSRWFCHSTAKRREGRRKERKKEIEWGRVGVEKVGEAVGGRRRVAKASE